MFTVDVLLTHDTLMATLSDDTSIVSSDADPMSASEKLQNHFILLQIWRNKWKSATTLINIGYADNLYRSKIFLVHSLPYATLLYVLKRR